ncbi:MAG: threonine aldolase family protein [Clostridia bacterium]
MFKSFASDNYSGIHPEVLEALIRANTHHAASYGNDPYTKAVEEKFKAQFGPDIDVFFVFNGTGANVLSLRAVTRSYQSIVCSDVAHLHVDECGAPELFTGCKVLTVPTGDGKITPDGIKPHLYGFGDQHHSQPKVISITNSTEVGTVYRPEEIKAIAELAHEHGMYLHMDGSRLANAAASLELPLKALTADAGVDVLSFGGTKNGLMIGEAVLFFNRELAADFKFIRKQGMQLGSKMRFIAAQFDALLTNDLWLRNARHANRMAALLAESIQDVPKVRITQKVESNGVFAIVPPDIIPLLQQQHFFYVWSEAKSEVRWMASFDTTEEDVAQFAANIRQLCT